MRLRARRFIKWAYAVTIIAFALGAFILVLVMANSNRPPSDYEHFFVGMFFTAMGLTLSIFPKTLMNLQAEYQQQHWNYKYSRWEMKFGSVLNLVCGSMIVVLGLLILLGVVSVR